jgi:hypothetical protein
VRIMRAVRRREVQERSFVGSDGPATSYLRKNVDIIQYGDWKSLPSEIQNHGANEVDRSREEDVDIDVTKRASQ